MPIGDHVYYRIELPNNGPEDNIAIEEFKLVLEKILKYEKTPCPFKRGFTVDLPEPPETPVRLRPWRPRERVSLPSSSPQTKSGTHFVKQTEAVEFEDLESVENSPKATPTEASRHTEARIKYVDHSCADGSVNVIGDHKRDPGLDPQRSTRTSHNIVAMSETATRAPKHEAGRSVTAPPHFLFQSNPPFKPTATTLVSPQANLENESTSLSSSADSFHSFHSPISPLPPSPPYSNPPTPSPKIKDECDFVVPRTRNHRPDFSETINTRARHELWDLTPSINAEDVPMYTPSVPKTPTIGNDDSSQSEDTWPDVEMPSPLTQLRQRRAFSQRSTQSPLPSPTNIYSPSCQLSGHHLTTAILQKTCSLLLGPPVQLVALMLNIASKITKGTFRGAAYSYNESGQRIPCSWNFSDSEDDTDPAWEEDDYGVSLSYGTAGMRQGSTEELGGTWEID